MVIDPNNPTGSSYPTATRRARSSWPIARLAILADEVYSDLCYDGPVAPLGSLSPDAPVMSFSPLSKAYLAPGWRAGWLASAGLLRWTTCLGHQKAGRWTAVRSPMQYTVPATLTGDRTPSGEFLAALQLRATLTGERLGRAMPGVT